MLKPIPQTGVTDDPVEPSSRHDPGHDDPQHVAGDAAILRHVSAVSKFGRYFGKSPERLSLEDVRARRGSRPRAIPYAREPRTLRIVLSADEVVRFLEAASSLKSRAALTTAQGLGSWGAESGGHRQRAWRKIAT